MKEAMLYDKVDGKVRYYGKHRRCFPNISGKAKGFSVKCNLCYRRCVIDKGKTGFCNVRKNMNGKLYSLVYAKLASYSCNPIEKKPFFHFYPGSTSFSFSTVGCNFRCLHCQNYELSWAKPGGVPEFDFPPELIIKTAKDYGCSGISYTFTEPTVFFEYCYDTGRLAKKAGLNNNFVTNGYATPEAVRLASKFLDAVRIDLKGDGPYYKKICGGVKLESVLECISNFYKTGMHLEIITLVIHGDNDNRVVVRRFADFLKQLSRDIPWHFTRFYPAHKMLMVEPTPVKTLEKMHDWAKEEGMRYVYIGNVPGHSYENTYCPNCNELLIQRFSFSITKVNLGNGNRCPSCGKKIPIVGEAKLTGAPW